MTVKRRNTKAKAQVLELLEKQAKPMAQAELERLLKDEADRVTIYRILRSFCADGKVHKIIGDDGKTYFALCKETCASHHHHTDHHIHFRCVKCDKVECLEDEVQVNLPTGYTMEHSNYVISGKCINCQD
jgi:Fur family transcriptional regulator, ferric uptake regulator